MTPDDIKFIGVAGNIGAGKSTLAEGLAHRLTGYQVVGEPVLTNPYLEKFYHNPDKYAFPMQIWMLSQRFLQHQEIVHGPGGYIQDRTVWEDTLFADIQLNTGSMTPLDHATYTSVFRAIRPYLIPPDVVVALDVPPPVCLERILSRGRKAEQSVDPEAMIKYLYRLDEAYSRLFEELRDVGKLVRVQWDHPNLAAHVLEEIEAWKSERPRSHKLRRWV